MRDPYYCDYTPREEHEEAFAEAVEGTCRTRLTDLAEHYDDLLSAERDRRRRTLAKLLESAGRRYRRLGLAAHFGMDDDYAERSFRWADWCSMVRKNLRGEP